MNLYLNKLKENRIIYFAASSLLILLLASLVAFLRPLILDIANLPFTAIVVLKDEISGFIFYHHNLIQNERLKKEVDLLKQKLTNLDEIYLENKRLHELLSLKQEPTYKVIAASVIGRSPDNWSSIIIINKGSASGIKRGMVAVSYLGLVGKVIETAKFTSKIILINDPNFSVSAIVQRSRQEGLVSGTLGSSLMMRYLPRDCDVRAQDVVITSGLTSLYPKGLIIGSVIEVDEEFSGLGRYAIIKPTVNLSNLEEVLVIIQ